MFQHDRLNNEITLIQKIKNLDYIITLTLTLTLTPTLTLTMAVGGAGDPGRRALHRERRRLLLRDGRVGGEI